MRIAAAVLAATALLVLPGCGTGSGSDDEPDLVTVYASLPLSGDRAAEARAVRSGIADAYAKAGGRAGETLVEVVYLDDTEDGSWSPVVTAENARRAAEDSSTIAFIGDVDDGATRTSLPITNEADILQISPLSQAPDLTGFVSSRLNADLYQPSGEETYVGLYPREAEAEPCDRALGYEAMRLALVAIADAGSDRGGVVEFARGVRNRDSLIGTYSVEGNGEVTVKGPVGTACS